MVRTRNTGNFLWDIYSNALPSQQMRFKEILLEKSNGNANKMWQSFMKIQSDIEKSDNFNAEIIGVMVQTFVEDEIKLKFDLTDLEKLKMKHKRIQQVNSQTTLPVWKQSVTSC